MASVCAICIQFNFTSRRIVLYFSFVFVVSLCFRAISMRSTIASSVPPCLSPFTVCVYSVALNGYLMRWNSSSQFTFSACRQAGIKTLMGARATVHKHTSIHNVQATAKTTHRQRATGIQKHNPVNRFYAEFVWTVCLIVCTCLASSMCRFM